MAAGWARLSVDPRAPEAATRRASDADREVVLEVLREAYADGRLDVTEHDRRVDRALAVVVVADVLPLLGDLVSLDVPAPRRRTPRAEAEEKFRREDRDARNGAIGVSLLTTGIWAAVSIGQGDLMFFWPAFPTAALGVGWVMHRVNREQRVETLEEEIAARRRRLEG